jgi:hypothetical protein
MDKSLNIESFQNYFCLISMLPPDLFTAGCKVVYVCRNPKDTCASFFHHSQLWQKEHCDDYNHFEEMFLNGTLMYGSYWYNLKVGG